MLKALKLQKLSKTSNLKGPGASYRQKHFSETIVDKIFKINYKFHTLNLHKLPKNRSLWDPRKVVGKKCF